MDLPQSEKRVSDLFESLKSKNVLSEGTYNKLSVVGSKLGTLYGLTEVHKPHKN